VARLRPARPVPPPAGVASCRALLAYEGAGRTLVTRLKYGNARDALRWLAAAMAGLVDGGMLDVVTWVPTSAARRRRRGFDQAELLAARVAAELGRPLHPMLVRGRGPPQTGRSRTERLVGPSFGVGGPRRGRLPARVLLVDDVITTGATMAAAAAALAGAGVVELHGLTIAHTLPAGGS
jgi:predicted amidophosphoribosyltransferase